MSRCDSASTILAFPANEQEPTEQSGLWWWCRPSSVKRKSAIMPIMSA